MTKPGMSCTLKRLKKSKKYRSRDSTLIAISAHDSVGLLPVHRAGPPSAKQRQKTNAAGVRVKI
jgi:hypothetical protein